MKRCHVRRALVLCLFLAFLVLSGLIVTSAGIPGHDIDGVGARTARAAQVSPPISPLPHSDQADAESVRNALLDGAAGSVDLWYAFGTMAAAIGIVALTIRREP